MKRKIITINEDLCNGCGECTVGCSEGALQIVNGKAKLVREDFCDGFGDCIGTCPTGALKIEEKDVKEFDIEAVKDHLLKTGGQEAVWRMEEAQKKHEAPKHSGGGCPGMRQLFKPQNTEVKAVSSNNIEQVNRSELQQWPVQLHLVSPKSPFFQDREMVLMSTCAPIASADVHWRYLRGRSVVVACPKLDNTAPYVEKLAAIMKENRIPKIIILRMEVPCCSGLTKLLQMAHTLANTKIEIEEHTVSLDGKIIDIKKL